jgi:hypothetical protein
VHAPPRVAIREERAQRAQRASICPLNGPLRKKNRNACMTFPGSRAISSARLAASPPSAGPSRLEGLGLGPHATTMFVVTEAEADAIRAVYEQRGEFAAAVELRRLFPGVTDNAQARACARSIARWKPLPLRPVKRAPRLRRVR